MSTEWYINAFKNKDEQNVPLQDIMKICQEYEFEIFNDNIELKLNSEKVCLFFDQAENKISHLTVLRPTINAELKKILYRIMKLGNFILFAPEGNYPIILDESTESELPNDMTEALGKPKIAGNEDEFSSLLNKIYG